MSNLLIKGGKLVFPWGIFEADMLIIDGKIASIGRGINVDGVEVVNANGKLVFPGAVDEHVHMREPGLEYKDDFRSGTLDALMGGITTVLEMPNTIPPVDTATRLIEKRKLLENKAYVDFGLYGVIHDNNIAEFVSLVKAGAIGFKIFMGPTTGNIPAPSTPTLYEVMIKASRAGIPLAFHAEDWDLVKYFTEKIKALGRKDPLAHLEARPPICEEIAIRRLATIAKHTGAHIHILHVTSCEAIEAIKEFQLKKVKITAETNPHYLLLDSGDYSKYGSLIKVNPPIREPRHKMCLWTAIIDSVITTIGSDHAPHSLEEKNRDIWSAPGGFPGTATLLPLMIDQALRGRIDITMIPSLLAENPARIYRIYPRKGCIHIGCDGDLVVVDPSREYIIDREKLHTKHKLTPFHGWKLKGRIDYVILRGNIVYSEGSIIDKPLGTFITPLKKWLAV